MTEEEEFDKIIGEEYEYVKPVREHPTWREDLSDANFDPYAAIGQAAAQAFLDMTEDQRVKAKTGSVKILLTFGFFVLFIGGVVAFVLSADGFGRSSVFLLSGFLLWFGALFVAAKITKVTQ